MKTIKIYITGDILAVDYCTQIAEFEENYYLTCGWNTVTGLYVNPKNEWDLENEENVVKKKGKYVKNNQFFHGMMGDGTDHPLPVELHTRVYYNQFACYVLELEDEEEFDIKKVQLEKSMEFETDIIPYFIVAEYILYDGKKIDTEDTLDYCPEDKIYDEYVVEELLDRNY